MTKPRLARKFARYSFDTRLTISVHRSGAKHHLWGRTADISENGVAATVSDELRVGEVVSLQFSLGNQNMEMRAAVRFQKGHFCGFEFLTLQEQVREQIRSGCERLCESVTPECAWHVS